MVGSGGTSNDLHGQAPGTAKQTQIIASIPTKIQGREIKGLESFQTKDASKGDENGDNTASREVVNGTVTVIDKDCNI